MPFQLIEYFASACPHCTAMEPVWALAKSEASVSPDQFSDVKFVQKQCYDSHWNPGKDFDFCQTHRVEAFPKIELYQTDKAGSELDNPLSAPMLTATTNQGKADQLLDWLGEKTSHLSPHEAGMAGPAIWDLLASLMQRRLDKAHSGEDLSYLYREELGRFL